MTDGLSPQTPAPALARRHGDPAAAATRLALQLGTACAALLALLAAVAVLALQMHFESRDRDRLHAHLDTARALLASVDSAGALSALPARLQASFGDKADLAVRVQGALDQPLYEQGAQAAMPAALLSQPSAAPPAPLHTWRHDGSAWRGCAVVMRVPLAGAAPLTVAMALDIQPHDRFVRSFGGSVAGYVLLTALAFGLLARWLARRAFTRLQPAA